MGLFAQTEELLRTPRTLVLILACRLLVVSALLDWPAAERQALQVVIAERSVDREAEDALDALNLFGSTHTQRARRRAAVESGVKAQPQHGALESTPAVTQLYRRSDFHKDIRLIPAGLHREECPAQGKSTWVGFAIYLVVWCVVAVAFWLWRRKRPVEDPYQSSERNLQWDRVRFHLMTVIIWTHWMGKWGLNFHRAGWAFLSWSFTFHIVGFVFLSGIFSHGYAQQVATKGLGGLRRVALRCLDLLIVYVIFSWLRGLADFMLAKPRPGFDKMVATVLEGTFLFHQGPWYLAALIVWRLSALALWWVPAILVASLVLAALCPYHALDSMRDPFAMREILHYLPYFALGLVCGRHRLETFIGFFGMLTPWIGVMVLLLLAILIWFPFGYIYDDAAIRWILVKKDVPPASVGGLWTMLALYLAKTISTCAAIGLFSTPCGISAVDRVCEAVGKRSMTVYMVHMVFIMVPGDVFCVEHYFSSAASEHGVLTTFILLVLAVAANLLCGSDFSAWFFRPLIEPLATTGVLASKKAGLSSLPTLERESKQAARRATWR